VGRCTPRDLRGLREMSQRAQAGFGKGHGEPTAAILAVCGSTVTAFVTPEGRRESVGETFGSSVLEKKHSALLFLFFFMSPRDMTWGWMAGPEEREEVGWSRFRSPTAQVGDSCPQWQ